MKFNAAAFVQVWQGRSLERRHRLDIARERLAHELAQTRKEAYLAMVKRTYGKAGGKLLR